MTDGSVLAVGAAGDAGGVFAALSDDYTVHAEPAETLQWTWLDTADWRLHRAGLALREERNGRSRMLVLDRPGAAALTAAVRGFAWPARLERLEPSPVLTVIGEVVGVRALLPVAEVEVRRILLRLMDDIGKTRVRVSLEQQRLVTPRRVALPLHIVVRPLRGYDDDARRCVNLLQDSMSAQATAFSPTDAALAAAGRLPSGAASEPAPADPNEPALRLVARALLELLRSVDDAREGALADLDTEFLHDFRTAVRSTRALLATVGELLPGRSALRAERDLAWLDESTESMRAVDIALLGVSGDGDLDIVGPAGIEEPSVLEPLRTQLYRRRRNELRRMRQTLRSPRAPAAFTTWRGDLERMLDVDLIGVSVQEAIRSSTQRAYADLNTARKKDASLRVAELREVLRAFAPVHHAAGAATADVARLVTADVDAAHDLLRRRDGVRITSSQLRAATAVSTLPGASVLAAGALLDRAARRERDLDADIARALGTLTGRRTARRVEELVS